MRKLVWILLILVAIGLGIYLAADQLAERGIRHLLAGRDIPVQSLRVASIGRNHMVFRDVVLGEAGELKAAEAQVDVGWHGKKAERFDVVLKDADITARLQSGKVVLGGIERAWTKEIATGAPTDIHLLGDATVHYETNGALKFATEKATLTLQQKGDNILLPLDVALEAEGDIAKTIAITGTAASAKKELQLSFSGDYDMAARQGVIDWATKPVKFSPQGFTFAKLSPAYAADVTTFPMRLSAKGKLTLAKGSWQLTPAITFHSVELAPLLAGLLGEGASIKGEISGDVPLTITPDNWRIRPSTLNNKGNLSIAISSEMAAAGMLAQHPQADIVMKALANFQVDDMTLTARSTDDHGGINMTWHFLGRNPDLFNGKKVDFTLAVNANLEDIWMGATEAARLAEKAAKGEKG